MLNQANVLSYSVLNRIAMEGMINLFKNEKGVVVSNDNERDCKLVCLVREGDSSAFSELVRYYQKGIFKLAFNFFNDRDEAMEIVQETFLRSYEKLDKFDGVNNKKSFKSWIFRIAYNLCIDFYRKLKRGRVVNSEIFDSISETDYEKEVSRDIFERQHIKNSLKKYIMFLSKRQKQVFILKHYSGFKFSEISGIMNIAVGTVKSLHFRATKTLEQKVMQLEAIK